MNKDYYTPQDEHPADRIFKDAEFIGRLSDVQTGIFNLLVQDLNLNEDGESFLYDYIFNTDHHEEFEDYLRKRGIKYDEKIINIINRELAVKHGVYT